MVEFSAHTRSRSLFLTDFFAYLHCSAPSSWSKRALSKKKTSHGQHLARSGGRRALFSDTQNTCQPASSSENRVRHKVSNSLNNPINEHLQRTHSFALARNCAFGAIIILFRATRTSHAGAGGASRYVSE